MHLMSPKMRVSRSSALLTLVVAALLAGAAIAWSAEHSTPTTHIAVRVGSGAVAATSPAVVTPASLASAMSTALAGTTADVATVTATAGGKRVTVMSQAPNGAAQESTYNPSGQLVQIETWGASQSTPTVIANYLTKTWYSPANASRDTGSTSWIQQGLTSGQLHIDGTVTVNSRQATELTGTVLFNDPTVIYVDPITELPLSSTTTEPAGVLTLSYGWAPQTTATLAPFNNPVPAGFTKVAGATPSQTGPGIG